MLQRQVSLAWFLIVTAHTTSGAQAVNQGTGVVRHDTLSGTWGATNGSVRFMGTWTAVPDTTRGEVTGTWTLADANGATVAYGGWAAAKAADRWTGGWRARIAGRDGEYSGAWSSSVALEASARLAELFEAAAKTIVRGTWKISGRSGAWSIRAGQ